MYTLECNGYSVVTASASLASSLCKCESIVALGNFDGVHIAHRELVRRAIEMKKMLGCELVGAWSFRENPLEFFCGNAPRSIYSPEKKAEILLECGLDFVVLASFADFVDMQHKDFCKYLKRDIGAVGAVCGYNYRYGAGGAGNPVTLAESFGECNTAVVSEIDYEGAPVSSTRIRGLIESGDIRSANALLARPFSVVGEVVRGKQLGRTLGFPTANQCFTQGGIIPKNGIYTTKCKIDGEVYVGVTNIGVRPTVEQTENVNAETYILDFSGDIYGKEIEIEFVEYLREERKFSSLDELKNAVLYDAETARRTVKL